MFKHENIKKGNESEKRDVFSERLVFSSADNAAPCLLSRALKINVTLSVRRSDTGNALD